MKRYSNNQKLELDPTRYLFHNKVNNNNHLLPGFNKPINKLQDDIIINNLSIQKGKPKQYKSNPFDQEDISLQFLPKNNSQVIPITSRDTILNNNNSFRLKSMSQELMDKDEELQKYKNEIYQLQEDLNKIKVDKGKIISYTMENKSLKERLNEQYNLSKELSEVKHILKKERIDNKGNNETIKLLKNIIHKQHIKLNTKGFTEDGDETDYGTDEETDLSDSDYSSEEEEEEEEEEKKKTSKKYFNTALKRALLKQKIPAKKIDNLMIQMKITPRTKITRKLLVQFLNNLKK